jgi:hypothetical protein
MACLFKRLIKKTSFLSYTLHIYNGMHSTESAHRMHNHVHRKITKVQCIETSEYQMNVYLMSLF